MKSIIFLSGGGTMGSVMPLVALWERVRGDFDCIWIGSRGGMEKAYIEGLGIKYKAITSAKFRRYFDLRTFLAPLAVFLGFWESLGFLIRFRPRAIVVSGSFISVPLVWAGWFLGVRCVVHQEDLEIGLAGRLTIPFASVVTTAFSETCDEIKRKNEKTPVVEQTAVVEQSSLHGNGSLRGAAEKRKNIFWIGNPVREIFQNPDVKKWQSDLPLILVLGGGLGSERINRAVAEIAPGICKEARILHLTGKNKTVGHSATYSYTQMEGLWRGDLAGAMAAADIVVSRAGLSTLGELSALGKAAILVPLPDVGQEDNAKYFEKHGAALIAPQDNPGELLEKIKMLLRDVDKRKELSENIKKIFPANAAETLKNLI